MLSVLIFYKPSNPHRSLEFNTNCLMDKQENTHTLKISQTRILNPLVFGEVLFDEFEDGSSILGGAPFNVAWHLQGFGLLPVLITKIGNDNAGKTILQKMDHWGLQTHGVQIDDKHPTGKVTIKLNQGQPTYHIVPDQAYDNISRLIENKTRFVSNDTFLSNIVNCPLLYHGSLALRNKSSHDTLSELQKKYSLPTFVDINLRDPWWNQEIIQQSLNHATWAKLNDIELSEIAKQTNINNTDHKEAAVLLRKHFDLKLLIITLGAEGAHFISKNNTYFGTPVPANNIADTVGAGDAFSAVTILGLLKKWPIEVISQRAMAFASSVCELRGATSTNLDFYKNNLTQWEK